MGAHSKPWRCVESTIPAASPLHRQLTRPRLLRIYQMYGNSVPASLTKCPVDDDYDYSWFSAQREKCAARIKRRPKNKWITENGSFDSFPGGPSGLIDSGRIRSPIRRSSRGLRLRDFRLGRDSAGGGSRHRMGSSERKDHSDFNVLLVRPIPSEVPTTQQLVMDEYFRVAPKGREWDRQYALRHCVGRTAQEAIVDRLIDTRYRKPGDYLRRNNRGQLLSARGKPLRMS
uniref:Uncharacterized protein n=1 Tax=Trypanosoma congolense (strain IL3000) TaxID=1068625 RepID=G0UU32_TRYCI|nr:conserved hypothetical protein [Trypanosoma congolense IL3000]